MIRMYRLAYAVTITCLFACGETASDASSGADITSTGTGITLSDADNGKVVSVRPGQAIVLRLRAPGTSGGGPWTVENNGGLGPPRASFEAPVRATLGGSGTNVFRWEAAALTPGSHAVELQHSVPGHREARVFSVVITTAAASEELALSDVDTDKSSTIAAGTPITIRLKSLVTNGFTRWFSVDDAKPAGEDFGLGAPTLSHENPVQPSLGNGGTDVFKWNTDVAAPGRYIISLSALPPAGNSSVTAGVFVHQLTILGDRGVLITKANSDAAPGRVVNVVRGQPLRLLLATNPTDVQSFGPFAVTSDLGEPKETKQTTPDGWTRHMFVWNTDSASPGSHRVTATAPRIDRHTDLSDDATSYAIAVE